MDETTMNEILYSEVSPTYRLEKKADRVMIAMYLLFLLLVVAKFITLINLSWWFILPIPIIATILYSIFIIIIAVGEEDGR